MPDPIGGKEGVDMKRLVWTVVLGIGLAVLIAGCGSDFRKLPENEVDPGMRASAQELVTQLLTSWREGKFAPLGEEATLAMRSGLSPETQEQAYEQFKGMFGDFESMDYAETWVPADGSTLFIFRFKGRFTNTEATPEIRVVLDGQGKLSGLWVKPWKSRIQ